MVELLVPYDGNDKMLEGRRQGSMPLLIGSGDRAEEEDFRNVFQPQLSESVT